MSRPITPPASIARRLTRLAAPLPRGPCNLFRKKRSGSWDPPGFSTSEWGLLTIRKQPEKRILKNNSPIQEQRIKTAEKATIFCFSCFSAYIDQNLQPALVRKPVAECCK